MLRLQEFTQAVLTLRLGGAQVDTSGAQAREYSSWRSLLIDTAAKEKIIRPEI